MTDSHSIIDESISSTVAESLTALMSLFYRTVVSDVSFSDEQENTMAQLLLNAEDGDSISLRLFPSLLSDTNHLFSVTVNDEEVCTKELPYEHLALFSDRLDIDWSNETINQWFKKVRANEHHRFHASELSIKKLNPKRYTVRLINNAPVKDLKYSFNVGF